MNTPQEFAALLAGVRALQASGFSGGAALATLTRTRGPVFRRAGARMLVLADGSTVRGLAGGCPEADVIARAQQVIARQTPELARYDAEQGLDVLLEMGCGGELEILIEPLRSVEDIRFFDVIEACLQRRRSGVLATVFARDGQGLAPRPLRWIRAADEVLLDELAEPALGDAVPSLAAGLTASASVEQVPTRGGRYDVLLETLQPPLALFLIGVNATSLALARLAQGLGWQPTLIEQRSDAAWPELPPGASVRVCAPGELVQLPLDRRSAVVVMTHNVTRDVDTLLTLREIPLLYLGAIGSRNRVQRMLADTGLQPTQLHAPAGLDIGSETPEEIALAIAAEIQAVVAARPGGLLSRCDTPIHPA
jgi:xanthine dehydrogenase accessory factor